MPQVYTRTEMKERAPRFTALQTRAGGCFLPSLLIWHVFAATNRA